MTKPMTATKTAKKRETRNQQNAEAAIAAARKWWADAYAVVQQLVADARELAAEADRRGSPLAAVFRADKLRDFAGAIQDDDCNLIDALRPAGTALVLPDPLGNDQAGRPALPTAEAQAAIAAAEKAELVAAEVAQLEAADRDALIARCETEIATAKAIPTAAAESDLLRL